MNVKSFIKPDITMVLGGLILAGCLWAFLELAGMVVSGGTAAVDEKLPESFRLLRLRFLPDEFKLEFIEEL